MSENYHGIEIDIRVPTRIQKLKRQRDELLDACKLADEFIVALSQDASRTAGFTPQMRSHMQYVHLELVRAIAKAEGSGD